MARRPLLVVSHGGLRVSVLAVLSVTLCLMWAAARRGWGTESEAERACRLASQLLPSVYPYATNDLRIEDAHTQRGGRECRVAATWVDDQGAKRRASLTVDVGREEIRTYVGPPLTDLPDASPQGRLEAAEVFARARLGPFTDATRLVSQKRSMGLLYQFHWANVLPSGAWTGDWWSVVVDTREGRAGVKAFIRRHAPRRVTEDEVKVSRDQAVEAALETHERLRRRGQPAEVRETRLVLSSPNSPNDGPVWHVTLSGDESTRLDFQIDGMTGKVLRP